MRVGLFGDIFTGRTTTLQRLASLHGVQWDLRDPFLEIGSIKLRSSGAPVVRGNERSELLQWSDAFVIVLDAQVERFEATANLFESHRHAFIGKPRLYQINKVDICPAAWLHERLPELGWEPRMEVVETSMRHFGDNAALPVGVDTLWTAIQRLAPE